MKSYSQVGQDIWVLSLFPKGYKGYFLDLGCGDPVHFNNTKLLEEHGWDGRAVDIFDFKNQWMRRKAVFIQENALNIKNVLHRFDVNNIIDYLSIDVDTLHNNYRVLRNFIEAGYDFKALTIEHNAYLGKQFDEFERQPQREYLHGLGKNYDLIRPDVCPEGTTDIFEDWWINTKYINSI